MNHTKKDLEMEKQERLKTISKHFYDDECIGRAENGDLILHMGVKRKEYTIADTEMVGYENINYVALNADKYQERIKRHNDADETGDEVDNWE